MTEFKTRNNRIDNGLQAASSATQKLIKQLKMVRDNRLYLEGGYFSFQAYCEVELKQWGGYARVQSLLGEEGEN